MDVTVRNARGVRGGGSSGGSRLDATFRTSEPGIRAGVVAFPLEDGFPADRLFPEDRSQFDCMKYDSLWIVWYEKGWF